MKQLTPLHVDEYISSFPEDVQEKLQQLRAIIKKAAPNAEELISYKMPAYKLHGVLVYFAAYKNHIGLYATPTAHSQFKKELSAYKTGKGSVQFPLDKPMPYSLITKIVKYKVQQNLQQVKKKP
ncbi:DUF1801 domain-containing protein [Ferruginibacter lapsinanis]|uniref:iron chaperone n=1 Tax=Ferruginibacter lapsinanis TaxID=563172 RepID=UPI001E516645|nr:DUF1801 domain-containing protein [Ferruginibacter lapsinanis]UEG49670.1 DUF1801 domain-containing protein [Ferruginibacter lapsinanis]